MPLLCFDSTFYQKIFESKLISKGFLRWAKKEKIMKTNVWFIPINENDSHWSLLVRILNQNAIIYFVSLLGNPHPLIMNAICTLIQNESKREIDWNEWSLFIPKDLPTQNYLVEEWEGTAECMFASVL